METSHSRVKLEIITGESPVCGILLGTLLNNIWVSGEISREKNILNCMKIKLKISGTTWQLKNNKKIKPQ